MDITPDLGCCRTTDPEIVLSSSSSGPDDTMALGDSAGHSDQRDPGGDMTLGHPCGHRLWSSPQVSV